MTISTSHEFVFCMDLWKIINKLKLKFELAENVYITVIYSSKTFYMFHVVPAPYKWLVGFIRCCGLIDEWSFGKDVDGIVAFLRYCGWGKPPKISVWIAGVTASSQTKHLWNASLQGYNYIIWNINGSVPASVYRLLIHHILWAWCSIWSCIHWRIPQHNWKIKFVT